MANVRYTRRTRAAWPGIGGILAAATLLVMLASPVLAAPPLDTYLLDPTVTPRTGTTGTTYSFEITYRDGDRDRPDYVRVRIGPVVHQMDGRGWRWSRGVRFHWSGTLPAGTHDVAFEAHSHGDEDVRLSAGSVKVREPAAAKPKPDKKPKPKRHAKPKPKATAKPRPAAERPARHHRDRPAKSSKPKPKPKPRAEVTPAVVAPATPLLVVSPTPPAYLPAAPLDPTIVAPLPEPSAAPAAIAGLGAGGDGTDGPGAGGPGAGGPGGASSTSGPSVGDAATSPVAFLAALVGLGSGRLPELPLVPTVVTTTTAVTASMALGLFGKRRRDEDPDIPSAMLAAQAAEGIGVGGDGALGGLADPEVDEHRALDSIDGADVDTEAQLPRWRRPSLLQARKADPLRADVGAAPLTFSQGFAPASAGTERRRIRYTVVRLLDAPDELRANEIGVLGEGDEVELLEKQGVYWLVHTPNGGQGWIHQMTLAHLPTPAAYAEPTPAYAEPTPADAEPAPAADDPSRSLLDEPATAWTPSANAGAWPAAEPDIDDDVLQAYLASRGID